jgi:hypothetical protein
MTLTITTPGATDTTSFTVYSYNGKTAPDDVSTAPGTFSTVVIVYSAPSSTSSTTSTSTTSKSTISQSPAPTTSTSTTPSSSGTASSNLSPNDVAGIAVGTFIAGVLLALVGTCLFAMLRKRNRHSHGRRGHYRNPGYSQEDNRPMKEMSSSVQPLNGERDIRLDKVLLEPISSSDIKTDMSAIGSQIVQHVDNNYHLKPVDGLPASFTETLTVMRYSNFTSISTEQLGRLLLNVQTRRGAIRHLISYFIFSRIALTCDVDTSLLPSHIITFLRQMPPPEKTSGSREGM